MPKRRRKPFPDLDATVQPPAPRRAGLRRDERDPNEPAGEAGSGAGDIHAVGTPGGGAASGGVGGSNLGDGSPDEADLENALGAGIYDDAAEQSEPNERRLGMYETT